MKTRKRMALAALLILTLLCAALPQGALAAADGMIRVLLTRVGTSRSSVSFTTTCAYKAGSDTIPSGTSVTATASGGKITVSAGGKTWSGASVTLLRQAKGGVGVRFTAPSLSNTYCGDVLLSADGASVRPVLRIYIEDYLYGVVAYEMADSFPLEALKAQAVCARTYAMRLKKTGGYYDLTDSTTHQVFKGLNPSYANVISAVDGTRGQVLTYGGAYAGCWYTASNGGQTETTQNAWGGKVAYSVMKDDPFDLANPSSTKKSVTIPKDTVKKHLDDKIASMLKTAMASQLSAKGLSSASGDIRIEQVIAMKAHTPRFAAPSRTFTAVRFGVRVSSVHLASGKRATTSIAVDLKSYDQIAPALGLTIGSTPAPLVWVEEGKDSFTISFTRYGHGVGLSQRGAQQMAKEHGKTCSQILSFYFEGATLVKKDLADTTAQSGSAVVETAGKYATLAYGDRGDEVKALQSKLKELGFFGGEIGGNYLSITSDAVKAFQRAHGMTADGVATSAVQEAIFGSSASAAKPTASPTPAPTPAPTSAPSASAGPVQVGQNARATGTIPVFAVASTSAKRAGTLQTGATVRVYAIKGDWAAVSGSGAKGFVLVKQLQGTTAATPTPTAAPAAAPAPTSAPSATQETLKAGQTAWVEIPAGSRLTVYQKASTAAAKVAALQKGEQVYVFAAKSEWAAVKAGSVKGYVRVKYLTAKAPTGSASAPASPPAPTPAPTPAPSANETAWNAYAKVRVATGKQLPICAAPSYSAAKIAYAENGAKLRVLAKSGDWARVTDGKHTGYVPVKYVQIYG